MNDGDGIRITVSRENFTSKTAEERDWMLFEAISDLTVCVTRMNNSGCRWGQQADKMRTKKALTVAGLTGVMGGFLGAILKGKL